MSTLSWTDRILIVVLSTIALLVPFGKPASAAQVEAPDRTVTRIAVTYAEHTGNARYPNRHYFETNDGAAYRYKGYRACANAHEVAPRICRTVFWYAR